MKKNHANNWLVKFLSRSANRTEARRLAFRPRVEGLEDRVTPTVFLVTSTANGTGQVNDGTLRGEILASNLNPGANTIEFDIEPGGAQTIDLTTPLPTIANTATIDGTTQPGWTGISGPLITINGTSLKGMDNGLTLTASNCKVEGLVLQNFKNDGIEIFSNDNIVVGNTILANYIGIGLPTATSGNIIGGSGYIDPNQLNGNSYGVAIYGGSNSNTVMGNDFSDNNSAGMALASGADSNIIGGTLPGDGNNFMGGNYGIAIATDPVDSSYNIIQGNTLSGSVTAEIQVDSSNNTIGGATAAAGNSIQGLTSSYGVEIDSSSNTVENNIIGNTSSLGRAYNSDGIFVEGSNNTIGSPGSGNIISGNSDNGILIYTVGLDNSIQSNLIGTNTADLDLGNGAAGIDIQGGSDTIGSTAKGGGNVIVGNSAFPGNDSPGVLIESSAGQDTLYGNWIGVTPSGIELPNSNGVVILGSNNTVGSVASGGANTIAYNAQDGVIVGNTNDSSGGGAHADEIVGNSIYGNGSGGIYLQGQANNSVLSPTLISAVLSGSPSGDSGSPSGDIETRSMRIQGALPLYSNSSTIIFDFYASATPSSSSTIPTQGQVFLGQFEDTVPAARGTVAGRFILTIPVPATFSTIQTPLITATITDLSNDTSIFSAAVVDPEISPPQFTSAKLATFTVDTPANWQVTTSGFPAATLTAVGTLPKGVKFNSATGTLSGTPAPGSSGRYVLQIRAKNSVGSASQTLVIVVNKLIEQVAIPEQVSATSPTRVTALGHDLYEAVFTLTESPTTNLTGLIRIAGFSNLPSGIKFVSSTAAIFKGAGKKITIAVVFESATAPPLTAALPQVVPLVDEIIS